MPPAQIGRDTRTLPRADVPPERLATFARVPLSCDLRERRGACVCWPAASARCAHLPISSAKVPGRQGVVAAVPASAVCLAGSCKAGARAPSRSSRPRRVARASCALSPTSSSSSSSSPRLAFPRRVASCLPDPVCFRFVFAEDWSSFCRACVLPSHVRRSAWFARPLFAMTDVHCSLLLLLHF